MPDLFRRGKVLPEGRTNGEEARLIGKGVTALDATKQGSAFHIFSEGEITNPRKGPCPCTHCAAASRRFRVHGVRTCDSRDLKLAATATIMISVLEDRRCGVPAEHWKESRETMKTTKSLLLSAGLAAIMHTANAATIYYTDIVTLAGTAAVVRRVNADGTGMTTLVTGVQHPRGMTLDLASGKMYWTETGLSAIRRANLDGTGPVETVVWTGNTG